MECRILYKRMLIQCFTKVKNKKRKTRPVTENRLNEINLGDHFGLTDEQFRFIEDPGIETL